MGVAVKGP